MPYYGSVVNNPTHLLPLCNIGHRFVAYIRFILRRSRHWLARGDEDHGKDDDRHGDDRRWRDRFAQDQPAEKDGDYGIDVAVATYFRGINVLQEPNIGAEGDDGAKEEEVEKRKPGDGGNCSQIEARCFAAEQTGDDQHDAAGDHFRA